MEVSRVQVKKLNFQQLKILSHGIQPRQMFSKAERHRLRHFGQLDVFFRIIWCIEQGTLYLPDCS